MYVEEYRMPIRRATQEDVPRMVELSDAKRTEYAQYAPTFWRKAPDGAEKQALFFRSLLAQSHVIALVHDEGPDVTGFIIASMTTAPPVYDPGGPVCVIDDFTVVEPDAWPTIGAALLTEARSQAQARGVVLAIVVCGHLDEPKRMMLSECGYRVASEWYVHPL